MLSEIKNIYKLWFVKKEWIEPTGGRTFTFGRILQRLKGSMLRRWESCHPLGHNETALPFTYNPAKEG